MSKSSKTVDEVAQDKGIRVEDVNPKDVTARVISGEELKDMSRYVPGVTNFKLTLKLGL